jgi:hypothetical protein
MTPEPSPGFEAMLKFLCPNCATKIGVPEAYMGKRVKCPCCAQAASVPTIEHDEDPEPAHAAMEEGSAGGSWGNRSYGRQSGRGDPLAALADATTPTEESPTQALERRRRANAAKTLGAGIMGFVLAAALAVGINETIGLPRFSKPAPPAASAASRFTADQPAEPTVGPRADLPSSPAAPGSAVRDSTPVLSDWQSRLHEANDLLAHYHFDEALAILTDLRAQTTDAAGIADLDRRIDAVKRAMHDHNDAIFGDPKTPN